MGSLRLNALIIGGGAAGLWTLLALRRQGYSAALIESNACGLGQTVSSQGILHSGLKYSLQGLLTSAAREAREMPLLWRDCLLGQQQPDLSQTEILSDAFWLWGTDSAASRLGMTGAKLGLAVTPISVEGAARPECLQSCTGTVYRVGEQVISPASLIRNLLTHAPNGVWQVAPEELTWDHSPAGMAPSARIQPRDSLRAEPITLQPDWLILTAGAGNAELRQSLGLGSEKMQRRPLQMVLVRGPLPMFFGHCIDGAKTRISITSSREPDGQVVWQIGGQVSEVGVQMSSAELIRHTQNEVRELLPAIPIQHCDWTTYRVDRAEGATLTGGRPDSFRLLREKQILTGWPTKLVLVPQLAQAICQTVSQAGSQPRAVDLSSVPLPRPNVAAAPWQQDLWRRAAA